VLGTGTAIVTLALWLVLEGLPWPSRSFTVVLLGPLPALMLLQARLTDRMPEEAEREAVYVSSAVTVWVLAGLAMLAARFGGITREELGLVALPVGSLLLATGITVGAGIAIMALGRVVRVQESDLLGYLIPRSGSERIGFTGLSISAGIAEELVYRSFLIAVITAASGSLVVGAAVSVGAFAISHAYQGPLGVLRVALLGLVLTAPLLLTGSVYPSMIAHAALDLLAGLVLADWLLPDGE
jgi:membrane protease YdiL (CAAX protease family)